MAEYDYKEYARQMRENCVKDCNGNIVCSDELWEQIASIVENIPTADVVEVVRCKDCKHRETYECPMYFEEDIEWDDDGYTECETVVHDGTAENAYCSYGERKEE